MLPFISFPTSESMKSNDASQLKKLPGFSHQGEGRSAGPEPHSTVCWDSGENGQGEARAQRLHSEETPLP